MGGGGGRTAPSRELPLPRAAKTVQKSRGCPELDWSGILSRELVQIWKQDVSSGAEVPAGSSHWRPCDVSLPAMSCRTE
eukprot:1820357-Heterocapsa_arctica.AAC.1